MKVRDKLYQLVCWEDYRCRFQVYTHTITKINSRTIEVWGCKWKVSKLDIGTKYFTSKKAMYRYYLNQYREFIKPTIKAIKYFERKLKVEEK